MPESLLSLFLKCGSSYNLQFSSKQGSWKEASREKKTGVDLKVLGKEEHKGSQKAEVINTCYLEGSFVPTASSN